MKYLNMNNISTSIVQANIKANLEMKKFKDSQKRKAQKSNEESPDEISMMESAMFENATSNLTENERMEMLQNK